MHFTWILKWLVCWRIISISSWWFVYPILLVCVQVNRSSLCWRKLQTCWYKIWEMCFWNMFFHLMEKIVKLSSMYIDIQIYICICLLIAWDNFPSVLLSLFEFLRNKSRQFELYHYQTENQKYHLSCIVK